LRQQRFVREVTIQYNLCNEPWYVPEIIDLYQFTKIFVWYWFVCCHLYSMF
jgi:hypothetical protein